MALRLGDDHYLCMEDHSYVGGIKHHAQMASHKTTPLLCHYNNIPPSHVGRGYINAWAICPTQQKLFPI